ncbi:hypothetical protein llap_926 [Limosa lapponica baueri]|uniref:Uncharacterized protein n=1 Tax=Limosa lapponica baueri TaxID=1758121 RepID=A0A2I0URV0_LIMLA|nr:hypothetical protein llap_926 [Limosa lapponica baueri]
MSWILLSKGLHNNLQNDLIEEAMEVQRSENLQWFLMYKDPDGLISAMQAEGSMYLELIEGFNCRLQEPHSNDCRSALCNHVLLEAIR